MKLILKMGVKKNLVDSNIFILKTNTCEGKTREYTVNNNIFANLQ